MDHTNLVGIGEAARRFGLAESALRYWEQRGLLTPFTRRARSRRYGPDELHRIGLIQLWRETGLMSLDDIERVLGAHSPQWRDTVRDRLAVIEQQQARLAAAKEHLEHLLTCPDDDPAGECPYLRELTAESATG